MNEIKHTKTSMANQLRAFVTGAKTESVLAAIEGLGELGGAEAIAHIEELMDAQSETTTSDGAAIWASLLRAYGRAGRFLPD